MEKDKTRDDSLQRVCLCIFQTWFKQNATGAQRFILRKAWNALASKLENEMLKDEMWRLSENMEMSLNKPLENIETCVELVLKQDMLRGLYRMLFE